MLKTSESVTPNHPDKICDRISDAFLDHALEYNPDARCAIEVCAGHKQMFITGESTHVFTESEIASIILDVLGDADQYEIAHNIALQSPEIAQGVDTGGAGDQGIMVGFATKETEELIPLEHLLCRNLAQFIFEKHPFDGKTQVTLNEATNKIKTVVCSFQNVPKAELQQLVETWLAKVCVGYLPEDTVVLHINPCGDWNVGGFDADAGLTGRKLAVDNYGPQVPIGGGAFSGKDSTKVDRSGAYMARRIAVDILQGNHERSDEIDERIGRAGVEEIAEVMVKLAYSIGVAQPVQAVAIINPNSAVRPIIDVSEFYDLTPAGIIKFLDLKKPQFKNTAEWGHMGRGFKWDAQPVVRKKTS